MLTLNGCECDINKLSQTTENNVKHLLPHLLSISLGFLATYCTTRSLSSVLRMSVKYSSLPCRATVSREAT